MDRILWSSIQEGEHETLSLILPQIMLHAWGKNGVGVEHYLHQLCKETFQCGYPAEFEVLIKRQAGYWSEWNQFWLHAEPGEPVLAERLMAALRRIDFYTDDFAARILLRREYLHQLEANVAGLLLFSSR